MAATATPLPFASAPLQALAAWFFGPRPPALPTPPSASRATPAALARSARPAQAVKPPLRVVQVMESGSRTGAGRIVISGRMADVCAELDRLAAQEARREAQANAQRAAPTR